MLTDPCDLLRPLIATPTGNHCRLKGNPGQLAFLLLIGLCLLAVPSVQAADVGDQGHESVVNAVGMEFVLIPAGMFIMGSPLDEAHRDVSEIQHSVSITRPYLSLIHI